MPGELNLQALRQETFWTNRAEINDAERNNEMRKAGVPVPAVSIASRESGRL